MECSTVLPHVRIFEIVPILYGFLQNTDFLTDFCKNTKFCIKSIKSLIFAKRTIFLTSINLVIIFDYVEWANYIQFRAQHCQKYASHEKKLEIKVVRHWILSKKVRKRICLPAPPPPSRAMGNERFEAFLFNYKQLAFQVFFSMWCACNLLLFIYFFINPWNSNLKCL